MKDYLERYQKQLHCIPEQGFSEHLTADYICNELRAIGLTPHCGIAGTGIIAILDTGSAGPDTILRADMDALPITEPIDVPNPSQHEGWMHACGHDFHMAMLLGAARFLTEFHTKAIPQAGIDSSLPRLTGRVLFLFQPGEEGYGGANAMLSEGVLRGWENAAFITLHIWPLLPTGTIGVRPHGIMAAMDAFTLTIHGKGGHAATPHLCVDALDTACQVVNALQRIVSRMNNPLEPVLLSLGELHAGHAYNVIPHEAYIRGTVRTFSPAIRAEWAKQIYQVAHGICHAMGADLTLDFQAGHGAVINTPELAALVRDAALLSDEVLQVVEPEPSLCGEDASCFFEHLPGCLFFVGCAAKGTTAYPLHSPFFAPETASLFSGTEVLIRTVLQRCLFER